jgi:hypothetical protein
LVVWVMLNPSKADEVDPDPTITKCRKFAEAWGYGGIVVVNLFALRSTNPARLTRHEDPVGPENDKWILYNAANQTQMNAGLVVLAWGTKGLFKSRHLKVIRMLRERGITTHCLKKTKEGHPQHPLYVKDSTKPIPFED